MKNSYGDIKKNLVSESHEMDSTLAFYLFKISMNLKLIDIGSKVIIQYLTPNLDLEKRK